jgi:spermidine/putrescine transport system permease protein
MALGILAVVAGTLAALRWASGLGARAGDAPPDARLAGETHGRGSRWLYLPTTAAFVLIYLPLVAVVLFSFDGSAAPVMPLKGWTLSWYSTLVHDQDIRDAFVNTLKIGALCDVIVMVVATMAALALRGRRFPGRSVYEAWIEMPFLLPEVITGVALLTFFSQTHIALSLRTILIGHVLYTLGAAFRLIAARLESMPPSPEEAARDLGRGALGAFRLVTLPRARSALVTAALITFALSFDQTMITVLVTGTVNTLPTILWARMRIGFTPELNALAALLLGGSFVLSIPIALRLGRQRSVSG